MSLTFRRFWFLLVADAVRGVTAPADLIDDLDGRKLEPDRS